MSGLRFPSVPFLLAVGCACTVLAAPARAGESSAKEAPKAGFCGVGFTSYADMVAALEALAAGHPDIARVETIGTSVRGRAIVGLRISDNVATDEMEPEARIVGALHGNECMAFEVVLGVGRALVDGYGTDATATAIVDSVETFLVPMANPDGTVASTRSNAHGVDLNRNFPFMWVAGVSEGTPGSEPETLALRDDGLLHPYVLGLSYHTAADFVNLVWNYTPVAPRHEPELRALLEPYAVGTTYDVVLGWHWYSVYGEYTDHDYGTRGTLDTIIEIQSDYGTAAQQALHVPRALALLARADDGLAGRITDAVSGTPLSAAVWVDARRAPVFTAAGRGDFHTVLVAGTYEATVVAPLHRPARVTGLVVPASGHVWIDVTLEPAVESYGFAVSSTILSQEIRDARYANTSVPSDALGAPDGAAFNLEPYGEIVIDLALDVTDHEGPELRIHAAPGGETDTADVEGSGRIGGPWTSFGTVTGTTDLDLASSGLATLRYVHVTDTTGGRFGAAAAGYDLDSIEVLPAPAADADADADADGDGDADADADADAEDAADADGGPDADTDVEDSVDAPPADADDATAADVTDGDAAADADSSGEADGPVGDAGDADGGNGGTGCGCNVAGLAPAGGSLLVLGALALLSRRRRTAKSR